MKQRFAVALGILCVLPSAPALASDAHSIGVAKGFWGYMVAHNPGNMELARKSGEATEAARNLIENGEATADEVQRYADEGWVRARDGGQVPTITGGE